MRAALEAAVGYGLILAAIWSAFPARAWFGCLAVLWLIVVLLPEARAGSNFGLHLGGIRESLWAVALALLVFGIGVLCAALLGTLHFHYVPRPYPPMFGYLVFSFVQEFVLQNLILTRALRLLGRPPLAIGAAGLLLSMAHLPNLLLVFATLVWGLAACWLFFHYRNLYVVGFIHFLLGVAMAICVPASIQHNMRVGRSYLAYRQAQYAPLRTAGIASSVPHSKDHTSPEPSRQASR